MCTQKVIEVVTESHGLGKNLSELLLLRKKEKFWRSIYSLLDRQYKEMKTFVSVHQQESKSNEYAVPRIDTRTIGLQAVSCPKKVNQSCDKNIGYLKIEVC